MGPLNLSADELLSTTRAVRKRLDLSRPVEWEVLQECLELAQPAPTGGLRQGWHFVIVTDPSTRAALADLYRKGFVEIPREPDALAAFIAERAPDRIEAYTRLTESVLYLHDHLQDVPVLVIPCVEWPSDPFHQVGPGAWSSVIQATWSFMLAARSRGLGTAWTSASVAHEAQVAELLGIPYPDVRQVALIPVAYTIGTEFRPGPRAPLEQIVHRERW